MGTGITAVFAVLLLATPLASARGTITYTAPFTGFSVVPSNYAVQTGCAAETQPTPASWNASTGSFQASATTAAGRCVTSNLAEVYSAFEIFSPKFRAPVAGFGYVYVSVSSAFLAKASVHLAPPSNGSYGYAYSSVSMSVAVYVYDVSPHNGTLFGYAIDSLVSQSFSSTGRFLLSSGWTNTTAYATGTFVRGHLYQAQLEVTALIYAETYGGGSTASASIDVSGGNGVTISSLIAS